MAIVTDNKPELTLVRQPSAEDLVALFERISGRKGTAVEKQELTEIITARRVEMRRRCALAVRHVAPTNPSESAAICQSD